jgi:hypothetical protein
VGGGLARWAAEVPPQPRVSGREWAGLEGGVPKEEDRWRKKTARVSRDGNGKRELDDSREVDALG